MQQSPNSQAPQAKFTTCPKKYEKKYADLKRKEQEFEEGEWVYIRLQPYFQTSVAHQRNLKLTSRNFEPYKVLRKVGVVAYTLDLPPSSRIHPTLHVS